MTMCLFFIFTIYFFGLANANSYVGSNSLNLLDRDLHQRVLDSDECQRQLQYIRKDNSLLLAQFLDAGSRTPKGVLKGNRNDYGNYHQCLSIQNDVQHMSIHGKFCLIRVAVNQNYQYTNVTSQTSFDTSYLKLPLYSKEKLEEHNAHINNMQEIYGNVIEAPRTSPDSPLLNAAFKLALCIPKVCTTKEVLNSSIINLIDLDLKYEDIYCRLPNDRPWAPVDYVAIVLFSLIGLLTILSTSYDVYQRVLCKRDPKNLNAILITFSAYRNCQRLIIIKSNPNAIECLDGIRVLSTLWVVVGHVFLAFAFGTANLLDAISWITSYNGIMILTATLSVDTFFLMSGLLLVYTSAHKLTGCQLIKNLPLFYLNRLLRMFPVLAAVVLFEASLYNRLGDGPVWDKVFLSVEKCRSYWWTTLLYVQNYVNPRDMCLDVTWYLAIDVQLHILSPIILFWVLGRKNRMALSVLALALLLSLTACSAYIFAKDFSDGFQFFVSVYINTLTRAPPFLVGMIYGYSLHMIRGKKSRIPTKLNYCLTTLSTLLLALIIYCHFKTRQPGFKHQAIKDTFDSFSKALWGLGVGWIIYVCHTGSGGPINWFLSLNMWKIPSRISYATYLIHLSLMTNAYANALNPLYFTVKRVMFDAMSFILITLVVSFLVTILIDSPFAILCRLFFGCASKRPEEKGERNEVSLNGDIPELQQTKNE